jgi:hypothetical protein
MKGFCRLAPWLLVACLWGPAQTPAQNAVPGEEAILRRPGILLLPVALFIAFRLTGGRGRRLTLPSRGFSVLRRYRGPWPTTAWDPVTWACISSTWSSRTYRVAASYH